MKAKTYSALQKIYDQSYLTCSTAVYYEGQGNETDALRCWRECLGQLQGYSPGAHRPKTDTERTLLQSLKTMQEQCQDRVDLLQTILLSKVEAVSAGQDGGPGRLNSNSSMRLNRSPSAPSAVPYPGFYAPIPSIPLPERASTVLPCTNHPTPGFQPIAAPPPHALNPKTDRSAAADKRVLLSTLRTTRKQKKGELSSLRDDGAAAAKAATLAWTSISRAQGANLSQTLNGPSVENLPTIRTGSTASGSTLDLPIRERPSPGSSRQPSPPLVRPGFPQEKYRGYDYSLPRRPSEPSFGDDPPTPPPHKQFLSTGDIPRAYSTSSLVPPPSSHPAEPMPRYSWESDPSSVKPPIPPPKIPVEPLAQPTSLHTFGGRGGSGGVSDTEKYPTPSATNNTTRERIDIQQGPDISSTRRRRKPVQNEGHVLLGENEGTSPIESEKDKQERGWNERVEKALQSIGKGVDPAAARQVANEIVVKGDVVHWEDVAGLDAAKLALKEAVVYPFLRPDLFSGLREPARGMLLFGPPGTGKTMLARAVATESKSTFFSISASSLTSKYLGESEKLVRALFALAKALAPSIIFVDEIDSLLSSRSGSGEHEATRRIKTEFLIQWSDLARAAAGKETTIGDASRVLVLAATNLPWAIDEAARRRFVRRQYIPLPEATTRERQMRNLLGHQKHQLSEDDMQRLVELTDGFSGSDLTALAKDAAMGPLRSLGEALLHMTMDQIRSISFEDFEASLVSIRPSVGQEGLQAYDDWAKQYGERV